MLLLSGWGKFTSMNYMSQSVIKSNYGSHPGSNVWMFAPEFLLWNSLAEFHVNHHILVMLETSLLSTITRKPAAFPRWWQLPAKTIHRALRPFSHHDVDLDQYTAGPGSSSSHWLQIFEKHLFFFLFFWMRKKLPFLIWTAEVESLLQSPLSRYCALFIYFLFWCHSQIVFLLKEHISCHGALSKRYHKILCSRCQ